MSFGSTVSATTIAFCRIVSAAARYFSRRSGVVREHVADVVEAVADVVAGKVGGGLEIDADQVADRVVVFGAVEPADA